MVGEDNEKQDETKQLAAIRLYVLIIQVCSDVFSVLACLEVFLQ